MKAPPMKAKKVIKAMKAVKKPRATAKAMKAPMKRKLSPRLRSLIL